VTWEWQVWRCFEEVREAFEEKGWEFRFPEHNDNEVMPLLTESDETYIAFLRRDSGTGECFFEVREKASRRVTVVCGVHNIPTPARAARLLADQDVPSEGVALPVSPVIASAHTG